LNKKSATVRGAFNYFYKSSLMASCNCLHWCCWLAFFMYWYWASGSECAGTAKSRAPVHWHHRNQPDKALHWHNRRQVKTQQFSLNRTQSETQQILISQMAAWNTITSGWHHKKKLETMNMKSRSIMMECGRR